MPIYFKPHDRNLLYNLVDFWNLNGVRVPKDFLTQYLAPLSSVYNKVNEFLEAWLKQEGAHIYEEHKDIHTKMHPFFAKPRMYF